MADPLQSTAPIPPAGGNPPNRHPGRGAKEPPPRQEPPAPRATDRVSVHGGRLFGLQMLRERVLAHTRSLLELTEHLAVPVFAEVPEDETVGEFLGRLLSAQNQLAAQRAGQWDAGRLRRCVDAGLRGGAEETCAMLADGRDELALAAAAAVLVEYGRRLQALCTEPTA
jgi:hypothetical protein